MSQNDMAYAMARKQYYVDKENCFKKALREAAEIRAFEQVERLCNEYGQFLETHQDAFV